MEKEYIKDKTTGTYEPEELNEKAIAEVTEEENPEDEESVIEENIVERKENFDK